MSKDRKLALYSFGKETGVPLVLVHGLFGSARNWRAFARHLSKDRWVVTVDLRNHGASFWDDDNSYTSLASDLSNTIDDLGGLADVMGHSMGGKAAMVLALQNERFVQNLIIADIAPVEYSHSQSDNITIMQELPLEQFDRRSAAQAYLAGKLRDNALAAFFAQSLIFDGDQTTWQLNLSALKSNMTNIIGFPALSGRFERPALFMRGSVSDYVDEKGLKRVSEMFPAAKVTAIDDAGHWLHVDKPRAFMSILSGYLS